MSRERFAVPAGIYLLSHSVGCLPVSAKASFEHQFLDPWLNQGGDAWPDWLAAIDRFCEQLASLIGGEAIDFCPQANLSSGLTKFLCSVHRPDQPSVRKRVLMHASSFPSMGFVVNALADYGFELVLIDEHKPADDVEVWQQAMSDNIDIVLVSHVYSNTGVMAPIAQVSALCRRNQQLCIVDAAQSVGVRPIDVVAWDADLVLGSCVKWLCGGPGAAFMWLNPEIQARTKPVDVGWFSHQNPFEFDIRHFESATGAKKFWGGTPSVAPYALAQGSLQQINALGLHAITAHNRHLQKIVLDEAAPLLSRPVDADNIGGTLCLEVKHSKAEQVINRLQQHQCKFDQRGATLRLSFHIYNTEEEAQRVASAFK